MKEKKKYSRLEIVALVFCVLGCSLLLANKFIESDLDLFPYALGLNGIGIVALLFGKKSDKVE